MALTGGHSASDPGPSPGMTATAMEEKKVWCLIIDHPGAFVRKADFMDQLQFDWEFIPLGTYLLIKLFATAGNYTDIHCKWKWKMVGAS